MCGFIIKTLHHQHVSIFNGSSSGRPYINHKAYNMKNNKILKVIPLHCIKSWCAELCTEVPFHHRSILQAVSKILSLCGYVSFILDHTPSTFYTSVCCARYQDLLHCTSVILKFLLYLRFYTH